MNRFKKFTSMFDREKLNLYKRFLKKATEDKPSELPPTQEAPLKAHAKEAKPEKPPTLDIPIDVSEKSKPAKPKLFIKDGPHLYISKLLNAKGPMTGPQMWREYKKDTDALQMRYFTSKHHLKKKILKTMMNQGKIIKVGYSAIQKAHLGYGLVPEKAFNRTDPQVLLNIQPRPKIRRFEKVEMMDLLKNEEAKKGTSEEKKAE